MQSSFSNQSRRSRRQRIEKPDVDDQDDGTVEDPNFSIENLRLPYHMMAIHHKKQLQTCQRQYKKLSQDFLDKHIKPRVILFVADGTDLKDIGPQRNRDGKLEYGAWVGPNNIAIDVNKYIAKYDFDIAAKL